MPITNALGWLRDLPDHRDLHPSHPNVQALFDLLPAAREPPPAATGLVDLREYFPPVTDQRPWNSCAAHACIAMLEYFQRRTSGDVTRYSAAFLYRTTRRLQRQSGDTGAGLRATLKAIAHFGLPPEALFPGEPRDPDREPDAFAYSAASRFSRLTYLRLDPPGSPSMEGLRRLKSFVAAGFAVVLGFPVTGLLVESADFLVPRAIDACIGGLAVVTAGYDDSRRVSSASRGAFLVRASWGGEWGEGGYGWLPFEYVLLGLAVDHWTLFAPDWASTNDFRRPEL